MGQIKWVSGLVMVIIFSIAVLSYALNFADVNNAPVGLRNDSAFSDLQSALINEAGPSSKNISNASQAFFNSSIEAGSETFVTGGTFKAVGKTFKEVIPSIFTVISKYLFGGNTTFAVILTFIAILFAIIAILYIVKTWKGGNPD